MKPKNLLDELALRPVCGDGAMGTLLMARGMTSGACGMAWNIDRAEDVKAIHDAYRAAGSQLITTNSFGGSRFVLDHHGRAADVRALNFAAAQVARAAAGEDAWCSATWAPAGISSNPSATSPKTRCVRGLVIKSRLC
jgi:methionine synthase I (cobalamin-dependent)